jgi:mannose-1-phosphate guanylyltransferase
MLHRHAAALRAIPVDLPDVGRIAVLILAGGSGTRLWPLSTRSRPKQFAALGDPSRSMLQLTWDRIPPYVDRERVFVNVARGFEALALEQLPVLAPCNLIVAPEERSTLPICGYAALRIEERWPGATILVLASDSHVGGLDCFHEALLECCLAAQAGPFLVALGVRPDHPSTQYGYMAVGERAGFGLSVYHGVGYAEKPTLRVAERLVAEGCHDWNAGIFAWSIDSFLWACRLHAPAHHAVLDDLRGRLGTLAPGDLARRFAMLPREDVDRGLMERLPSACAAAPAPCMMLVRGRFDWDDIGGFPALARRLPQDAVGNAIRGCVDARESEGCLLVCEAPFELHVQGLSRVQVAVNAQGDMIVCPRDDAASVPALAHEPLFCGLKRDGEGRLAPNASCDGSRVQAFARLSHAPGNTIRSDGEGVIAVRGITGCLVEVSGRRVSVSRAPQEMHEPAEALDWVTVDEDHEAMSRRAAQAVVGALRELLALRPHPVIVASAGRTPVRVYELLRQQYRHALAWERLNFFQMDEYVMAYAADVGTCRRFLEASLVSPLGMRAAWLDGNETAAALQDHERRIEQLGGIDLVLHGIGENGHLGFNEPGSAFDCGARQVVLAQSTRPKDTPPERRPVEGVTLGLRQLNAARRVLLLASGRTKRHAISRALLAPPDVSCPASSLQLHPDVKFYIDRGACSWLGARDV